MPERPGTESEQLMWPRFHSEMLTNMTWSAGESLGRIKVVVAEGWRNSEHYTEPFQRVRNLVCFAFQHAPLSKWSVLLFNSLHECLRKYLVGC